MADDTQVSTAVKTGAQLAGEYILPGGSNLVKGDLKQAGLHFALSLAARAFLGPLGAMLVSANSLSKAMTDHHLHENMGIIEEPTGRPTPRPSQP